MAAVVVNHRSGHPSSGGPYGLVKTIVRELRKRVYRHNQLVDGCFRVVRECYSLLDEDDKKLCVAPSTQRGRDYLEHDFPAVEVVHMLDESPFVLGRGGSRARDLKRKYNPSCVNRVLCDAVELAHVRIGTDSAVLGHVLRTVVRLENSKVVALFAMV